MEVGKSKPKHLGRGLESLLGPINTAGRAVPEAPKASDSPKYPQDNELQDAVRRLPLDIIDANPYQPRSDWDDGQLQELAASIKEKGVIQPVIVREHEGKYQLIAGERRFRASRLARLETIPAIVRSATDAEMLELALIENIHRAELNPIERALAYQAYLKEFSLTQAEAAQRLGEDRSVIANHVRLLDLPHEVRRMLIERQLSMGHARAILALPTDELRRKLANRALAGRLSVREVERLVRGCQQEKPAAPIQDNRKPANIIDLENRWTRTLGTRVSIDARKGGKRGRVVIEFYSVDDFERICQTMGITSLDEI